NTCSISTNPGTSSSNARSIPALSVIVELGQVPHAPSKRSITTPSSTSTNSTSPPSLNKKGRNLSKTASTCSYIVSFVVVIYITPNVYREITLSICYNRKQNRNLSVHRRIYK